MKHLLLVLALTLLGWGLSAQETYKDVVYLKNGSIIRGMIIEQVPNESIKIQTADGSVFFYTMDEIQKIARELVATQRRRDIRRAARRQISFKDISGYRGMIEAGYSFGVGGNPSDRVEASTSHGYQFGQYFFLGAGVNVQYHYLGDDAVFLPVFAHARFNILKRDITPFLDVKFGYSFIDNEGYYLFTGAGCSANPGWKSAARLYLLVGYSLQRTTVNEPIGWWGDIDRTKGLHSLSIKLGLEF